MSNRAFRHAPYSPMQLALRAVLLTAKKPLDIHELVDSYYGKEERPWNAEIVVRKALRELIAKSVHNRENFIIQQTKQVGRRPALFRLIRKNGGRRTAAHVNP